MGRILLAFRVFFGVLFNRETATRVTQVFAGLQAPAPTHPSPAPAVPAPQPEARPRPEPRRPAQSEAITLLATLQREARIVDFLQEDLSGYSDEQVGAAVRAIHHDASKVLDRMFGIQPVVTDAEGAAIEVPAGFDAGRFRLTGHVTGAAPYQGTLQHHGWEATKCDLPQFTGNESGAKTIAPAEVEVR